MAGAYVQSNHNRASGASSLDVTLTGVVAGNTLVFVGTKYKDPLTADQFTSVSGGGATWARRSEAQTGGGAHIRIEIWVGVGGTGGSITATMDPGTSGDLAAILFEISGLDASTPYDTQAAATGTSTEPDSGATATLAQADSFKIMGACHETGTVSFQPRAGDGDTEVTGEEAGDTGMVVVGAYQVLSATTAINGRWTLGSSANWCAAVIALKAASVTTFLCTSSRQRARPGPFRPGIAR